MENCFFISINIFILSINIFLFRSNYIHKGAYHLTPYVRSNVIYCRYAVVVWRLLVMRSHIGQTNERVGLHLRKHYFPSMHCVVMKKFCIGSMYLAPFSGD